MKIKYLIFFSLALVLLASYISKNPMNERHVARDYVRDSETAIKVAEAILLPIYGKGIYDKKPFVAKLSADSNTWIVEGTLDRHLVGGVPHIEIRKSDCKILRVSHGK
jgi:hypothetical protein